MEIHNRIRQPILRQHWYCAQHLVSNNTVADKLPSAVQSPDKTSGLDKNQILYFRTFQDFFRQRRQPYMINDNQRTMRKQLTAGDRLGTRCPCSRAVSTSVQHGCNFGHPYWRVVFTGVHRHLLTTRETGRVDGPDQAIDFSPTGSGLSEVWNTPHIISNVNKLQWLTLTSVHGKNHRFGVGSRWYQSTLFPKISRNPST